MVRFQLRAQGIYHVVVKVLVIIRYEGLGQAIPADDIMFEAGYLPFC